MASNAVSFQGSTLHIGTGTGGAITVTAVTKAFKAEVTGTNTLTKGDRVAFASIVGMTELNGNTYTVIDADAAAFVIDVDSRDFTTYTSGGTATPVTWTQVKDIKSINKNAGGRTEIDVTNLDSTSKEKRLGLRDNGIMAGDVNIDLTDPGQNACRLSEGSDDVKSFKVTLAAGDVATFSGQVKKMDWGGAVDAAFTGSYEISITGDVEWS